MAKDDEKNLIREWLHQDIDKLDVTEVGTVYKFTRTLIAEVGDITGKSPCAGWEPGDRFCYKGCRKGTVLKRDEKYPHRYSIVWDDCNHVSSIELRKGYHEKIPNNRRSG